MASAYSCQRDEVKVEEFVTVKLISSTNYLTWRSRMLSLILSHGLYGFIDGKGRPRDKNWKRTDQLLKQWILDTLDPDLLLLDSVSVVHSKTAKALWKLLEKKYNDAACKRINDYLPLAKAVIHGNRKEVTKRLKEEPDIDRAIITDAFETMLMVAARNVESKNDIVRQMVVKKMMTPIVVAMVINKYGLTALHIAARAGNIKVVKLLVEQNSRLPNIGNCAGELPIHFAAFTGESETIDYLSTVTRKTEDLVPGVVAAYSTFLIRSKLYDHTLPLIERHRGKIKGEALDPLIAIAQMKSAFRSGAGLNLWQNWLFDYVPVKGKPTEDYRSDRGDIENAADYFSSDYFSTPVRQKFDGLFRNIAEKVTLIKNIQQKKSNHQVALKIVKLLCDEIANSDAASPFKTILKAAVCSGVHEVVEEILDSFPSVVNLYDNEPTIFQEAIVYRCEKVFNIIYQYQGLRDLFLRRRGKMTDNGLHLVGDFKEVQKSILRSTAAGAALQMQRELQWFEVVRELSQPKDEEEENAEHMTPMVLFAKKHEELVKEGEKWMKDTAGSCTIVASLIVTIVFASAITVPGGNNDDNGLPVFESKTAFIIFATSDALALFSSTSSLLLFLSILTSRYAQEDFLNTLPKRLIFGFITLFLSIIFMMIAFGATLQILFGHKYRWLLLPVIGLGSIPVTLFMSLQFPLVYEMFKCTYCYKKRIFSKQSKRILL